VATVVAAVMTPCVTRKISLRVRGRRIRSMASQGSEAPPQLVWL
jgi:hypothetical protein